MARKPLKMPLPLGKRVSPWGKIQAVLLTRGERYYMFVGSEGTVALLPWSVVELPVNGGPLI